MQELASRPVQELGLVGFDTLAHAKYRSCPAAPSREHDIIQKQSQAWDNARQSEKQWEVTSRGRPSARDSTAPRPPPMTRARYPTAITKSKAAFSAERVRVRTLLEDKLEQAVSNVFGMVARVVSQAEIDKTPEAQKAMDAESEKVRKETCWLEDKVREYDDVAAEARKNNAKVHFGRIFEICSQKRSELPDRGPSKKWKGRSLF